MRVVHLISSAGWYGAENVLVNLAAASRSLGCDAVAGVLCDARNPHTEVAERAEARGVPAEIFHCSGRMDAGAIGRLRGWLARTGVDIVHTHGYKANFYASAALFGRSMGWVTTCHTGTDQPETTPLLRVYDTINRFLLRRVERVVAVSPAIAAGLLAEGIDETRIATIGNGVDAARFELPHQPEGVPVVGIVGRLIREKGPYILLEAARRIIGEYPKTLFVFVGDGPERVELERAAAEAGLADNVQFAGERSDMPEVYASFDVFAQPSFSEGMPMTVLEAMAAGLPIVATSVGAIPSLLGESERGLLCPPGDAAALAGQILRILRDGDLAARLGAAARQHLRAHYSAEAMARQYLALYGELRRGHE
ncbi:glycosyltransferase [Paludibaculum fermentans]|uniref:Glycosyltransferase n=1 Tax=Paludibaculum fermentans TaxID=1473598 RepID=A0A7S7NYU2_PALFE|nr:glycosyltransferase [Paludibaculum fermentans]QOY92299.1 glycosyltransferase [Paludibaculum fermentans]